MQSQNPIISVSPGASTILVNAIGSGLYGGTGYNAFNYVVHVPKSLPAGEYVIDVVATYGTAQGTSYLNLRLLDDADIPLCLRRS